jgi:hypothetical protein
MFLCSFRFIRRVADEAAEGKPDSSGRLADASIQPAQVQIEGLARQRAGSASPDRPEVLLLRIDDLAIPDARGNGRELLPFVGRIRASALAPWQPRVFPFHKEKTPAGQYAKGFVAIVFVACMSF